MNGEPNYISPSFESRSHVHARTQLATLSHANVVIGMGKIASFSVQLPINMHACVVLRPSSSPVLLTVRFSFVDLCPSSILARVGSTTLRDDAKATHQDD